MEIFIAVRSFVGLLRLLRLGHARGKARWHAEQLHDIVLFMANMGLRPDEVKQLEFRDV